MVNSLENIIIEKLSRKKLIETIKELNAGQLGLIKENERLSKRLSHNSWRIKELKDKINNR